MLLVLPPTVRALDDDEFNGFAADTLTITVGYFGGPYYTKKVFTLDELWSLDVQYVDYTFIDNMPSVVIDHVAGITLADLMDAAGIDLGSIQSFNFWTRDKQSDYYTSLSKTFLIDTPRYCYYSLPDNFDYDERAGNEYATLDGARVPTMIALGDDWNRSIAGASFGSDYENLNTNTRFRLVFGQTDAIAHTASQSAKWIHKIEVTLGGAPTVTMDGSALDMKVGSVFRTEARVNLADAVLAGHTKVDWSSSDDSIATVDENGTVTVHREGTATITARVGDSVSTITVTGRPENWVAPNGGGSVGTPSGLTGNAVGYPLSILPGANVQAIGNDGGVQNWRTDEMAANAIALPNIARKNPMVVVMAVGALAFVLVGGGVKLITYRKSVGGK
jgi:hypothetical protein